MDIFQAIYYFSLFCGPILLYFIFRKTPEKTRYSTPNWYHVLKKWKAKKEIAGYKEKHKDMEAIILKENELPKKLEGITETDTQVIFASDIDGNHIVLKMSLRAHNHGEINIFLKLKDGRVYTLPNTPDSLICSVLGGKWRADNLEITILQPLMRLRITYNGFLQCQNQNGSCDVQHVSFNLIWNAASEPFFNPANSNNNLLSDALAREQWKDRYWMELIDVEKGYEQFGELKGFIRGSNFEDDYILELPSWRQRFYGPLEAKCLYRNFTLFGVCENGLIFNIGVKSYRRSCSHMKYGLVIEPNKNTFTIDDNDISLEHLFNTSTPPDAFVVHFKANKKSYRCVCHVNKNSEIFVNNNEENGWKQSIFQGECDVNQQQAICLISSWRRQRCSGVILPPQLVKSLSKANYDKIFVSPLNDSHSQILEVSGGKGNSLSLLANIKSDKFTVPDGFIVTVDAFKNQISSNKKLGDALKQLEGSARENSLQKLSENCQKVSELFASEPINENIKNEVNKQIDEFNKTNGDLKWAVRSSGVSEDSEDLSAAGQNSTFLGCSNQEILKAIGQCWGSLYSFQSLQYRRQHGLPIYAEMAVVVQKMVPSDVAGVLFTCHPTSGSPAEMVITANYGLGESVVSGQADPDTIILSRDYLGNVEVKTETIGAKRNQITMAKVHNSTESGTLVENVSNEASKKLCLTKEQAVLLGEVGVFLEKTFGGPRDIEWAFYQDKLYLLQSRPITTLNTMTDFELRHELDSPILSKNNVFTRANVGEVMPHAMTVLSQSFVQRIVEEGINLNSFKKAMPYGSKVMIKYEHHLFLDMLNGLYIMQDKDITLSDKVLDIAILGHVFKDEKIHKQALERNGSMTPYIKIRELITSLLEAYHSQKVYEKAVKLGKNHDVIIEENDSLEDILKKLDNFTPIMRYIAKLHGSTSKISVFYQFLAMQILAGNSQDLTSDHFHDISYLLSSCTGVVSAEVPVILDEIAQEILSNSFSEEFVKLEPKNCLQFIKNKVPKAYKIYEDFMEAYGHRSMNEFEVAAKSWNMDEELIMQMIQVNAKTKTFTKKSKVLTVDETISKLISVQNSTTKKILKWIVGKCRNAVKYREATKSELIRCIHKSRLVFVSLAEKMTKMGYLTDPNQIYHFTIYELKEYIKTRNPTLISKAIRRHKLFKAWDALKYEEMHLSRPMAENDKDTQDFEFISKDDNLKLSGTPVYTGNVVARCCVVPDLSKIDQLKSGDILITHSTDIAWSPYFPILAGIVTELGGLISHGAVVAREYGLPSIVGVKDASKYFKTGDKVLLNGKNGTIELIERNEEE